jgi:hypothetical protein
MLLRCRRLIFIDFAALLLLSFVLVNTSAAQGTPASIVFDGVQVYSCQGDILEGFLALAVVDASGSPLDLASLPDVLFTFRTESTIVTELLPASVITGVSYGVTLPGMDGGSLEFTAALSPDYSVRSATLKINCATLAYEIIGGNSESGDGRLNPNAGDLLDVLYMGTDESGMPSIDVYQVDGDSGIYIGEFTYELFEPYLDAAPETNTELGTVDKATLYALTSGEFQINIGPDAEGKYGIVIFSGLPASSTRRSILELR